LSDYLEICAEARPNFTLKNTRAQDTIEKGDTTDQVGNAEERGIAEEGAEKGKTEKRDQPQNAPKAGYLERNNFRLFVSVITTASTIFLISGYLSDE
jgi:hypothetical protein